MTSTLADLGMDSLMGTEIKQTLERNFDMILSVGDIRNLTMGKLFDLQGNGSVSSAAATDGPPDDTIQLKQQVCTSMGSRVNCFYIACDMGFTLRPK